MNIDEIISKTLHSEGGFVDHSLDKGGATRYGITEAVARDNGYKGAMSELSLDLAIKIYKSEYWLQPRFSLVHSLNAKIAAELFDSGVNTGTSTAAKFLQQALNLLNQNGKLYADLVVDGGIGQKTLDALKIVLARQNGESVMLKVLNGLQFVRYKDICERNPNQSVFLWGWVSHRIS